ncbi:MAG: lytic transglycosylase domain-containing protein [Xanthobacteraceae bacterium]
MKIGKLLLLVFTLFVSAALELRASTDALPPADMSFAYPISHAVTPLSDAVIEKIADQDGEAMAVDELDDFKTIPEKPVGLRAGSPQVLSRDGLCGAVAAVARANDLPITFFANLIWQESSFNSKTVSRAGAQGIAQFMPRTAFEYGLINPFEPIHALNVAGKMLRELSGQFGNLGLAAAAYNAGPRRVIAWLAKRGELPAETRRYVLAITGHSTEQWADTKVKADPEVSLMPAKAPCVEVAEAVEEQAGVVRVSKLIVELAEATAAPAGEMREAGKSDEAESKIAHAKPDRNSPATRMAKLALKESAGEDPAKTSTKTSTKMPTKTSTKTATRTEIKTAAKAASKAASKTASKTAGKTAAKTPTKIASETAEKSLGQPDSRSAESKVALTEESEKAAKHATRRRPGGVRRTRIAEFDRHRI